MRRDNYRNWCNFLQLTTVDKILLCAFDIMNNQPVNCSFQKKIQNWGPSRPGSLAALELLHLPRYSTLHIYIFGDQENHQYLLNQLNPNITCLFSFQNGAFVIIAVDAALIAFSLIICRISYLTFMTKHFYVVKFEIQFSSLI